MTATHKFPMPTVSLDLTTSARHYGYHRLTARVRREGWAANHKRVLRLMRTDNLLCLRRRALVPVTTDSRHGWRVVPNPTRGIELTGLDQLWVADITYLRLLEEFAFLAVVLDAAPELSAAIRNSDAASAATRAARMRSSRPTAAWTLDSAHLEEREGERGHRDHPQTPVILHRRGVVVKGRAAGCGSGCRG
jgi:HTH-like domain